MRLPAGIDRLRRRAFGRYEIDDPRPIAKEAPYTFELPSAEQLVAVAPGDLAQLTIRSIPRSPQWDAERMWVLVERADGDQLHGRLENSPLDMPQLRPGSPIAFCRHNIIGIVWDDDRVAAPPQAAPSLSYWERCLVDLCVTEEQIPVHYVYREEPDLAAAGDAHPDSGWRIRGDFRGLSDEEIGARETEYVALGRVLNADDSWIHLIDAPAGSAFIRDWETGEFVPEV